MRTPLRTTLPTLAALLLALSACTTSPAPTPPPLEPSGAATSAPSPTPTALPPQGLDDIFQARQDESPVEFVRRWVKATDVVQATGRTELMGSLVRRSCFACSQFERNVRAVYEDGGRVESKETDVLKAALNGGDEMAATVDLKVRTAPTVIHSGSGDVQRNESEILAFRVYLAAENDRWLVAAYERMPA